ncbi:hypothetical protein [Chitinophaga nivalis]|uniref:Uncharacterized protein n=1 Tax=Chitinophaga nivalis TaxID=2991709 RepID=A0ABT3IGF3_9BACT|nr:hypothetical protein [Chitinophaga nivalis]MCW3467274.1 hypothetical protein [Chitinophaga nivalis]MCW3483034.1 hypothetical protein [Chitinophaga nivalis]
MKISAYHIILTLLLAVFSLAGQSNAFAAVSWQHQEDRVAVWNSQDANCTLTAMAPEDIFALLAILKDADSVDDTDTVATTYQLSRLAGLLTAFYQSLFLSAEKPMLAGSMFLDTHIAGEPPPRYILFHTIRIPFLPLS